MTNNASKGTVKPLRIRHCPKCLATDPVQADGGRLRCACGHEAAEDQFSLTAYQLTLHDHLNEEHGLTAGMPAGEDLEALHRQAHEDEGQFSLLPGYDREQATDTLHVHDGDEVDPAYVHCPECGSVDLETADTVPGQAGVQIRLAPAEPGGLEFDWSGDTRMVWDGQTTEVDAVGRLELWCPSCSQSFYDDRVRREEYRAPRIVIVVEGGIATVAQRPEGLEVVIVDYDTESEDECVVNIDGPEGFYTAPDSTLADIAEQEELKAAPEVA